MSFSTQFGRPMPMGVARLRQGTNFAIFSQSAKTIFLHLFAPTTFEPLAVFELHRTGAIWHILLEVDCAGYGYTYSINEKSATQLTDPYAKAIYNPRHYGKKPTRGQKAYGHIGVILGDDTFDWAGDRPLRRPLQELIIYEMHVRGFTKDASSGCKHPGTFAGLIEKIPYLQSLGINTVELMPVQEYNELEYGHDTLCNYWGYSSQNFFALMGRYASTTEPLKVIEEFKAMVKALHKAGIEVILDVVFNHTSEGNEKGPLQSMKGFENDVYYMMTEQGQYYNFSGCGNTLNCNHPVVRELIRSVLRYYVTELHIDGFRFDLASILSRDSNGAPLPSPPLIEIIALDPILSDTKLIAEAWDAGGLYQVGHFYPQIGSWLEWNGPFRDSCRRYLNGNAFEASTFATRISGSQDLYSNGRSPSHSVNFITSHDGFCLTDLVSFEHKANLANGEGNRDGDNANYSANFGTEGSTKDARICQLRSHQRKNFQLALLLSQGVPMLLMGDEYGHSKSGNNNTWCHDSRLNWFCWDILEQNSAAFRFTKELIAFRKRHPQLHLGRFLNKDELIWYGADGKAPVWNTALYVLGLSLYTVHEELFVFFHIAGFPQDCILPPSRTKAPWKRIIDTSLPSPHDIEKEDKAPPYTKDAYTLQAHSAVVFFAKH